MVKTGIYPKALTFSDVLISPVIWLTTLVKQVPPDA